MSELSENLIGVKQIPIFPLPLVLFPNEILPLHIFEERYRQMLKDVQLGNKLFGISFFDVNESITDKPEIGSIGCVAEVREVQALENGRSNIVTVGLMRYEITGYIAATTPYLIAEITFFQDDLEDEMELKPIATEVHTLFKRIAEAAHSISEQKGAFPDFPQAEPETLSFLVASGFNLPTKLKIELIKTRSTITRLDRLKGILEQATEQLEEGAHIKKIAKTNGHSKKKIDF